MDFTDGYTKHLFSGRGKKPPRLDQTLDVPHFSKSHLTVLIQVTDIGAFVVNRYIALCSGFSESYLGEREKVEYWYRLMAENMLNHTSIDPPGEDKLCTFYRGIRPSGWSGKEMAATAIAKNKKQPTLCDGI